MRKIGVREAKARLSELLKDVERGREWTITARGRAVARLVPVTKKETAAQWIARLGREGRVIPPPPGAKWPEPVLPAEDGELLQRWLQEDRDATW